MGFSLSIVLVITRMGIGLPLFCLIITKLSSNMLYLLIYSAKKYIYIYVILTYPKYVFWVFSLSLSLYDYDWFSVTMFGCMWW